MVMMQAIILSNKATGIIGLINQNKEWFTGSNHMKWNAGPLNTTIFVGIPIGL